MSLNRPLLFLLFLCLPITASAGVSVKDLPEGTLWYLHVDLKQMRNTDSGRGIYLWLDAEVFEEISDEVGLDLNKETDSLTVISDAVLGTSILIEGQMTSGTRQRIIDLARLEGELIEHAHKGKDYYFIKREESDHGRHNSHGSMEGFEDGAYFSFAVRNKILISSSEQQMKELLTNGGEVTGSESDDGAMFVLAADRVFAQAGLYTAELADDDDDWNSNILRNTEQVVLTIADQDGMVAIDSTLVSTDPKMAQSIGGIVGGLISLQAFNSDLDPELKSLLSSIKVNVTKNILSISMVVSADVIVSALNGNVRVGI